VSPGGSTSFTADDLLKNDDDPDGNTFTFTGIDSTTSHGVLLMVGLGIPPMPTYYLYNTAPGFHGEDTLHYSIQDSTGLTGTANVRFLVDTAPLASDDYYSATQDTNLFITDFMYLSNDTDTDGDKFHLIDLDTTTAAGGSASFDQAGNVLYTPPNGFHGADSVQYTIADDLGVTSSATFHIQVDGSPVVVNETYAIVKGRHLTVPAGALLANDFDPEGANLKITQGSDVQNGQLYFHTDGSFDYQPNPGFTGIDSFTYRVDDSYSLTSGTVSVVVADDLPTASTPELELGYDTGASDKDNITDARRPGLQGVALPGMLVTVYVDGVEVAQTTADADGSWTAELVEPLSVGRHWITVTESDSSGNEGPQSAPLKIVIVGEPVGRVATAAIAGATPTAAKLPQSVAVFDGNGNSLFNLSPGWKVSEGVRIATGDVTGDGIADIAVTPTSGAKLGTVRVYDGVTGNLVMNQVPIATGVKTSIALGDVNGDGYADLVAAGLGGKAAGRVVGISGTSQLPLFDWTKAAGTTVHGVTVGDVNGDLIADVLLQQTQKPFGTDVVAFNASDRSLIHRYDGAKFGLTPTSRVAVGSITGDGMSDLIVSSTGKTNLISLVNGQDGTILNFFTTPGSGTGTRAVAAADLNNDGIVEIVIGSGKGPKSDGLVNVIDGAGQSITSYDPFGPGFHGTLEV
jgi:Bacterial Ig domain/Bacterial Ig-like domain/FG-GAP-like repeat/FG-GAP repeat